MKNLMAIVAVMVLAVHAVAAPEVKVKIGHPKLFADADEFMRIRSDKSELAALVRAKVFAEAEAVLTEPPVERVVEGRRLLCVSRLAVSRLTHLSMAYRISDDRRYLERAKRELFALCSFSDWNPSHFLDTAEAMFAAALTYDWIYDQLTASERETVRRTLIEKGLKADHENSRWMDWNNNWNLVCHTGYLAAALAIYDEYPELAHDYISAAIELMPNALKSYEGGNFPEGPAGYWQYATEYLSCALGMLESACGTVYGLDRIPGVAEQPDYLDTLTGPLGTYFNYSDSEVHFTFTPRTFSVASFYLAKHFNRPDSLATYEMPALRRAMTEKPAGSTRRSYGRLMPLLLFWLPEKEPQPPAKRELATYLGGGNPVASIRSAWNDRNAAYLAIKGGGPGHSHSHQDGGNFIFDRDGVRWFWDLGSEDYHKLEQAKVDLWNGLPGADRWKILRYSLAIHNTIKIDDGEQIGRGNGVFVNPIPHGFNKVTIDLTSLYTNATKVIRTAELKGRRLEIRDHIEAKPGSVVEWSAVVHGSPSVNGRVLHLADSGQTLDVIGSCDWQLKDISKPPHDYESLNVGFYRAWMSAVVPDSGVLEFSARTEKALSVAERDLKAKLPGLFAKSAAHYLALDAAATPQAVATNDLFEGKEKTRLQFPHGFNRAKKCLDMRSIYWWTSGHYPGSLWYLYEGTGNEKLRERAIWWTDRLAPNATADTNHDLGFIMNCSLGNARRILATDKYDQLLVQTAKTLSQRFSSELGLIRSWGEKDDRETFLVIPDNMMNLELLEVASSISSDKSYDLVAKSHADKSMVNHFRQDGGCYHVLNYDQRPGFVGTVQEIRRGQGLSCRTAWSRGQSWGIYGYTMMYRETREARYLEFAKKLSDFAINHANMPADGVPYWDFGAPGEERDSSAASCMASALLELASFVGPEDAARYRAFAVRQLLTLSTPEYFSEGDEIGHFLLKHGVGHKPAGGEIDTPLNYGDYYYLEALLRFRKYIDGLL